MAPRVFALNVHANWACRHSGACCSAGWAIPVEPSRRAVLGTDLLIPDADGVCRFHDRDAKRCRVHAEHGEDMLPGSCVHFPRRALIDNRGVHVSLSHFCPTAARMLVTTPGPLHIVENPPAFPATRPYEGLDGRETWPPLIKADLLFDLPGYERWERHVVGVLADGTGDVLDSLARLAADVEALREWTPEEGPLEAHVQRLTESRRTAAACQGAWRRYQRLTDSATWDDVVACVPDGLDRPAATTAGTDQAGAPALDVEVRRRYLAAKAFASWSAYDALGMRTALAELVVADSVLRVEGTRHPAIEAVRAADWLLVHLVDRPALMAWLSRLE